tara:strand:+ start:266 stop:376 length:111 start_codon:yes stop_codon:yes gene_type:complete
MLMIIIATMLMAMIVMMIVRMEAKVVETGVTYIRGS